MVQSRQDVIDRYTGLHSQYTEMERQYKEALQQATSDNTNKEDLSQEVHRLRAFAQDSEARLQEQKSELEAAKLDKERIMDELQRVQDQLSGTAEAYMKLKSDSEDSAGKEGELDSLKSKLTQLEHNLQSSREEATREQEAKNLALAELQQAQEYIDKSKETADELLKLSQENEALRSSLLQAEERKQQVAVHEPIVPTHSTPRNEALPNAAAELYDGTHYSERELSGDVLALRQDVQALQTQYNKDTSQLRSELAEERKNMEGLRLELHESLNSSTHSIDSSNIANLTDLVSTLQNKNEQLHSEKQELNRQLMEQERLCEKLHDRLGVSESLSSGVQESYAKQLAATQRQRDEILAQLEEASKVNEQVSQIISERNALQHETSEARVRLRENDDLEVELLKLKTQLESLTHSHTKMSEMLTQKDEVGLELGKRNAILEAAVTQMESRLKESEKSFQDEQRLAHASQEEIRNANRRRAELEQRLSEEKISHRNRLTAELQQTRAAAEKNRIVQIRQERLDIERKYKEAIDKLRLELADESRRKQESLKSQHATQVKQMETLHEKQVPLNQSS